MSSPEYLDLEAKDSEVDMVLSIGHVKRLAQALGVTSSELVTGERVEPGSRLSYAEVVSRVRGYCSSHGLGQRAFEDVVGWELDNFFAGEESMLANYPVDFLRHLCEPLHVPWRRALP